MKLESRESPSTLPAPTPAREEGQPPAQYGGGSGQTPLLGGGGRLVHPSCFACSGAATGMKGEKEAGTSVFRATFGAPCNLTAGCALCLPKSQGGGGWGSWVNLLSISLEKGPSPTPLCTELNLLIPKTGVGDTKQELPYKPLLHQAETELCVTQLGQNSWPHGAPGFYLPFRDTIPAGGRRGPPSGFRSEPSGGKTKSFPGAGNGVWDAGCPLQGPRVLGVEQGGVPCQAPLLAFISHHNR